MLVSPLVYDGVRCQMPKEKMSKEKTKIIAIAGDFNYDLLKYGTDIKTESFLNLMIENHFQPCITEPTRIVEGNIPSLVDNIFTKNIYEPMW